MKNDDAEFSSTHVSYLFLQFLWLAPYFLALLRNLFLSVKRTLPPPRLKAKEDRLIKMFRGGIDFHKIGLSFSFPSFSVTIWNPMDRKTKKKKLAKISQKFHKNYQVKKNVKLVLIFIGSLKFLFLWNSCTLVQEKEITKYVKGIVSNNTGET